MALNFPEKLLLFQEWQDGPGRYQRNKLHPIGHVVQNFHGTKFPQQIY